MASAPATSSSRSDPCVVIVENVINKKNGGEWRKEKKGRVFE